MNCRTRVWGCLFYLRVTIPVCYQSLRLNFGAVDPRQSVDSNQKTCKRQPEEGSEVASLAFCWGFVTRIYGQPLVIYSPWNIRNMVLDGVMNYPRWQDEDCENTLHSENPSKQSVARGFVERPKKVPKRLPNGLPQSIRLVLDRQRFVGLQNLISQECPPSQPLLLDPVLQDVVILSPGRHRGLGPGRWTEVVPGLCQRRTSRHLDRLMT